LWPATNQTSVLPFTVPMLGRDKLFLRAEDWTRVDSNGDGIPDWWIWNYFGNLSETATNLDSQGNTLGYDYTNNFDPNLISFDILVTNNHVNSSHPALQLNVTGLPAYYVVLVNDSNQADAVWQPYTSSNLTAVLGADGNYDVSVGLRGHANNATAIWEDVMLIKDTVPPVITVSNPVAGTVSQPMIQIQGYANETLGSLTFVVSNAAGLFPNQAGYATGSVYDTNLLMFTTNYFQCYDVALTNGLNVITILAADLAGNVTTDSVSYTLNYSGDTLAPALNILWPQNGTVICGSQFTARAQADDATAKVMASLVDGTGNTNTVQGLVERGGLVWMDNLPLASGTNTLTITATDAAGNSTTTNLMLVQSAVLVTMNPLTGDQWNQPSVTVTGTISEPGYDVWVNGVQATTNGPGTWEADNVPVSLTGTAIFDAEVYVGDPELAGSQCFNQVQPPMVVLSDFEQNSVADFVQDSTVQWNYAGGGSWSGWRLGQPFLLDGGPIPPAGTNYSAPVLAAAPFGIFAPAWQNADATYDDGNFFQTSVHATVMIVPSGPKLPGVLKTYTVRARAEQFSPLIGFPAGGDISFFYPQLEAVYFSYGNAPVPSAQLRLNGQPLSGSVTNDDGPLAGQNIWGQTSVSAPAGALVPLKVTSTNPTNNDYTFGVEIVQDKLYWQNMVQTEMDTDSGVVIENYKASSGFLANRNNLLAVFNFYGKLFAEQPDEFYWAGLAKLVGAPVYAGLSDAEYAKAGTLGVGTVSGSLITEILTTSYLIPKMNQFQQIMLQMNIDIMNDLTWQFEAYEKGGLDALEKIDAADVTHTIVDIDSWEEIDDGIQNNDVSEIQDGNQLLAFREQNATVKQDYQDLQNLLPNTGIFSFSYTNTVGFIVSYLGQNPIIGGPNFWNFEPTGADLTVFDYRWDWTTRTGTGINQGIIPLWLSLSDSARSSDVQQPIKTRAQQFSYVYQWLGLPLY
jgi:hypothetical protein